MTFMFLPNLDQITSLHCNPQLIYFFLFQFAMLSGKAPFYSKAKSDAATSIMRRIKEGDFRLEGESWRYVSTAARNLTKGLLTVDPRKRLSMDQLCNSPWVASAGSQLHSSQQPSLLTASVLLAEPTERCLKQTYDAFHNVTREGFRLTPVSSASSKLLQKRKLKQSISSETSTSSLSDRSSLGSTTMTSTPSSKHWSDTVHVTARSKDLEIFSFKSGHVQQYLSSSSTTANSRTGAFTHPLASRTPLGVPLMVQVPNVTQYSSSQYTNYTPTPALAFPLPSTTQYQPSTFQETISGVSLSLIQPDHNVINSSSVIQKTISPFQPSQCEARSCELNCACSDVSMECSGPLTRSRKRRLQDGEMVITNSQDPLAPLDLKVAKSKMKRTGTIIIE